MSSKLKQGSKVGECSEALTVNLEEGSLVACYLYSQERGYVSEHDFAQ